MIKLAIAREFLFLVREGKKSSTIRKGTRRFEVGPAVLMSGNEQAAVRITGVSHTRFGLLTEEDARRDGFKTLAELDAALKRFYPSINNTAPVTIVRFQVI